MPKKFTKFNKKLSVSALRKMIYTLFLRTEIRFLNGLLVWRSKVFLQKSFNEFEYFLFLERLRKGLADEEGDLEILENTANPLHCPVRLYEFYLSRWWDKHTHEGSINQKWPMHRMKVSKCLIFPCPLDLKQPRVGEEERWCVLPSAWKECTHTQVSQSYNTKVTN